MIRAIVLAVALLLPSAALAGEGLPGGNWGLMDTGPGGNATGDIKLEPYDLCLSKDCGERMTLIVDGIAVIANNGEVIRFYKNNVRLSKILDLNGNMAYDATGIAWLGSDGGAGSHALGTGATGVGGELEVDGVAYLDAGTLLAVDQGVRSHDGQQVAFYPRLTAQTPDTGAIFTGPLSNGLIFAELGDIGYDFAHAQQTNPTFWGQSANQSATEWWSRTHDQTDAVYGTGAGDHRFNDDGGKGAATYVRTRTDSITFDGSATNDTTGNVLADGGFLIGVTGRVTTVVAGCTSMDIGDGVAADIFGDNIAVADETTFDNTAATASFAGPTLADNEITVTGVGGSCTSGVIALTAHYLDVSAATAD